MASEDELEKENPPPALNTEAVRRRTEMKSTSTRSRLVIVRRGIEDGREVEADFNMNGTS